MAKENELVAIQKDGKRLEVSPVMLQAHLRKGWMLSPEKEEAGPEILMVEVPEGVSLEDAEKALEALVPKKGKKPSKGKEQEPDKEPEEIAGEVPEELAEEPK